MEITLGQQYNVGEKPTVILYTYINRHAGTPEEDSILIMSIMLLNIEPYANRGACWVTIKM